MAFTFIQFLTLIVVHILHSQLRFKRFLIEYIFDYISNGFVIVHVLHI